MASQKRPYSHRLDTDDVIAIRRLLKRGQQPEIIAACWGVKLRTIVKVDRDMQRAQAEVGMHEAHI